MIVEHSNNIFEYCYQWPNDDDGNNSDNDDVSLINAYMPIMQQELR